MESTISPSGVKIAPAPAAGGDRTPRDLVPTRATLDAFTEEVARTKGVDVRVAEPLAPILVTTKNSVYRIIPLRRGDVNVLVHGGRFFPAPAEARLVGATFGGCLVQMDWIRVGMCMEIRKGTDDGLVITTRVIDVEVERERTAHSRAH